VAGLALVAVSIHTRSVVAVDQLEGFRALTVVVLLTLLRRVRWRYTSNVKATASTQIASGDYVDDPHANRLPSAFNHANQQRSPPVPDDSCGNSSKRES
jgi:hypothetical protein